MNNWGVAGYVRDKLVCGVTEGLTREQAVAGMPDMLKVAEAMAGSAPFEVKIIHNEVKLYILAKDFYEAHTNRYSLRQFWSDDKREWVADSDHATRYNEPVEMDAQEVVLEVNY